MSQPRAYSSLRQPLQTPPALQQGQQQGAQAGSYVLLSSDDDEAVPAPAAYAAAASAKEEPQLVTLESDSDGEEEASMPAASKGDAPAPAVAAIFPSTLPGQLGRGGAHTIAAAAALSASSAATAAEGVAAALGGASDQVPGRHTVYFLYVHCRKHRCMQDDPHAEIRVASHRAMSNEDLADIAG